MRTEILAKLNEFQKGYEQKNIAEIRGFVKEMFSDQKGLSVIGTDLNDWCETHEEIEGLITKHWQSDRKDWGTMDFKFPEVTVFEYDKVALVVSLGEMKNTVTEEELYSKTMDQASKALEREGSLELNVYEACRVMAKSLKEAEKGSDYVWPFRYTAVMVKENDGWKFHHMQFSMDAEFFWQYRYFNEAEVLPLIEMKKPFDQADEIRTVLARFQEGYTHRDASKLEAYYELFTLDEDMITIGTDAEELCIGGEELKEIVKSDWEFWGDLKTNVEDAIIVQHGDVAYFSTKAMISRKIEKSLMDTTFKASVVDYIFKSEKNPRERILHGLFDLVGRLHEREQGEVYYAPMRVSGFLVKRDERWKIHHIQYSDNMATPEVRV